MLGDSEDIWDSLLGVWLLASPSSWGVFVPSGSGEAGAVSQNPAVIPAPPPQMRAATASAFYSPLPTMQCDRLVSNDCHITLMPVSFRHPAVREIWPIYAEAITNVEMADKMGQNFRVGSL